MKEVGAASRSDLPGGGMPPSSPVRVVAVVGLGLVGGSLARALKSRDDPPKVMGMASDLSDVEGAVRAGAVDDVLSGPEALSGVDLVVYATPLQALLDLLPEHAPWLERALVTDVASLKAPVVDTARLLGLGDRFVGGHPMAGGEGTGFGASLPTLFRDAPVLLTTDTGSRAARDRVETFWRSLEARPAWVEAEAHDRQMVWISHLPQLVANALARVMEGAGTQPSQLGPGGRDMTRLAASSPAMWRDLLRHAAGLDAAALRLLAAETQALAEALEEGRFSQVEELMDETRVWRRGGREG